jgi:FlaA1/EpsC-like NDP-sugar epimerase
LVEREGPDLLLVAISHLAPHRLQEVLRICMNCDLPVKIIRDAVGVYDRLGLPAFEDIGLEDLLRRPRRNHDIGPVREIIDGKVVMVTGAGGSIGTEICRQLAKLAPAKLVLVDHSEPGLYQVTTELTDRFPEQPVLPLLMDCSDQAAVERAMLANGVQVVYHAAAYKHVPLVEENPTAGIRNNLRAAFSVAQAADCARVELMVLISSDKAVRPSNIMGATKRVCELLIQNMPTTHTRMCGVRFGNVLGSSGSVVPRLLSQIQRGGPVTVTHPDVTRFFMLIDEAVALVLQAGARARAGELCILDMGEPVRIDALARQLIFLSGSVPDKNISVVYTGLRPGEKVHEEVLHEEMERRIEIEGITIARGTVILWERLQFRLEALLEAAEEEDLNAVVINLKALVPDWQPSPRFSRHLESETNPIERRSYRTSDRHNSVS